ncbi:hypothetical protein MPL3356_370002 [Mesorhizobium plurifarium]|uniref:Uncharacterized protein n=2 Tax=Mesorhizobium plurifarium TaxID=69974 RepID=A0A090DWP5_MESPL|nr:hypothetical protein MPL3356_370002 [Mesorhizobium plurifarium]
MGGQTRRYSGDRLNSCLTLFAYPGLQKLEGEMTGRVGDGERDGDSSGDEGDSGDGTGEAALVLTPSYRRGQLRCREEEANDRWLTSLGTASQLGVLPIAKLYSKVLREASV